MEKDDVGYHLGTGILFERVIRQTDDSQQLGTLSKISAVSYTHLDVYKRQFPSSQIAASGSPIGLIKNAITSKITPFCGE